MRFGNTFYSDLFIRLAGGLLIGMIFAFIISEGSYLLLPDKQTPVREPEYVTLVIPYGTSEQVEAGAFNRQIPPNMRFVVGDVLIVKNEDVVAHQLGPVWVPPQTSGVLEMNQANTYRYDCSFQPNRELGITVLPRVNLATRIQAVMAIGLPTGMMLTIYSYLLPAKKKPGETEEKPS
jgi:hypothetical protein